MDSISEFLICNNAHQASFDSSALLHRAAVRCDVISCFTRSPPHPPLPVSDLSLSPSLKQKLMWSLLFICYRGNFTPILCDPSGTLSQNPLTIILQPYNPDLFFIKTLVQFGSFHKMPGSWIIIFRWLIWGLGYYGNIWRVQNQYSSLVVSNYSNITHFVHSVFYIEFEKKKKELIHVWLVGHISDKKCPVTSHYQASVNMI